MIVDLVDRLVDRIIQLFQHHKAVKRATLTEYLEPAYGAFEAVHGTYLESFERYRSRIKSEPDLLQAASPLLDDIRKENLFSAHTRAKVLELVEAGGDQSIDSFYGIIEAGDNNEVKGFVLAIRNYLLRARAADTELLDAAKEGKPGSFFSQRFNNSLIFDLDQVISENWRYLLDPTAARPPLSQEEASAEVSDIAHKSGIADSDPDRARKVRVIFALRALDRIVGEMQEGYEAVTKSYLAARRALGD
jgi:hypothetical protein